MRILFLPFLGILFLCGVTFVDGAEIDCAALTTEQLVPDFLADNCRVAKVLGAKDPSTVLDVSEWKATDLDPLFDAENLALNLRIHKIAFESLIFRCTEFTATLLDIQGNDKLTTIEMLKLDKTVGFGTGKIMIRGNNLLESKYIDALKALPKSTDSFIQEFKDCFFDVAVTKASTLADCEGVSSDLNLTGFTDTEITKELTYVVGCLTITNTKLTDLSFLKGVDKMGDKCISKDTLKSEISGNKDLCVLKDLKGAVEAAGGVIKDNDPDDACSTTCKIKDVTELTAVAAKRDSCTIVVANNGLKTLTISGFSDETELEAFKNTETIDGNLEITDNQFQKLTVFEKLKTVEADPTSSVPPIKISNTGFLAVSFPMLEGKSCSHAKIFELDSKTTLINRAGECNGGIFIDGSLMNYTDISISCELFCGDVTIRNFNESNKDQLNFFKDTKAISGSLTLKDNEIELLDVFTMLTTVDNVNRRRLSGKSSEAPITITANRLQAVYFPALAGTICSHANLFKVFSNPTLINRAGECNGGIFTADALMNYANVMKCDLFCGDATIQNFDELNVDQVNLFKAAKVIPDGSLTVKNDHKKIGSCPGYVFTPDSMQKFTEVNWWCYSFDGDVTIQNFNESNKDQLKFFNVTKVISGSLIVENNHFESFDFFLKLTTIGKGTYSQPAMKIVNNSFLAVNFPELADNIYSKTQKVVFLIEGNDKLNLSKEQVEEFQWLAGDSMGEWGGTYFQYDKMPKPEKKKVPSGLSVDVIAFICFVPLWFSSG